jgi:uncharacterized membrane protein YfcA
MISFPFLVLFTACFAAGIMNTLAGGGSFLTFPALLLTGLDPRAANITSTLALFPMQITSGYANRAAAGGTETLSFRAILTISLVGGAVGAALLLLTPRIIFARLVPWFILFATSLFAYSSFGMKPPTVPRSRHHLDTGEAAICQFGISVYGGYFGGGIGFLMLAALTLAGMGIRKAGATKNILAGVINASAVVIFLFSKDIGWRQVGVGAAASILGGMIGVRLLQKVNERGLRIAIVVIGLVLTIAMFVYEPQ